MTNKILGFFLLLIGLSFFIPIAFRLASKVAFVALGLFLTYKGLQLLGAHFILFHVDRVLYRFFTLFH